MTILYCMGLLMQVVGSLIAGSRIYCVERFSPNRWLDEVRACGATVSNALGVMPEMIFRTPETKYDLDNKLRIVIAVPIAAEWSEAMEQRFGFRFMQAFGGTGRGQHSPFHFGHVCGTYDKTKKGVWELYLSDMESTERSMAPGINFYGAAADQALEHLDPWHRPTGIVGDSSPAGSRETGGAHHA